jgi:hypothetical protein
MYIAIAIPFSFKPILQEQEESRLAKGVVRDF